MNSIKQLDKLPLLKTYDEQRIPNWLSQHFVIYFYDLKGSTLHILVWDENISKQLKQQKKIIFVDESDIITYGKLMQTKLLTLSLETKFAYILKPYIATPAGTEYTTIGHFDHTKKYSYISYFVPLDQVIGCKLTPIKCLQKGQK